MSELHWTQRPRPGWPGGLREWTESVFRNSTREENFLSRDIAEFFWRAFCLQWVAIAWCMLIGRES